LEKKRRIGKTSSPPSVKKKIRLVKGFEANESPVINPNCGGEKAKIRGSEEKAPTRRGAWGEEKA